MGSVTISIDAELGWGFHDYDSPPEHRVESARFGWQTLCSLLETYEIPATWAVVGHLYHESCDGRHPDHPAGPAWFQQERKWSNRPDLTCGPELIDRLREADVDHDVGCHTYSHVEFGDAPREVADFELRRCRELAAERGIELDSFVFPRNNLGHEELLAEHGFSVYRSRRPEPRSAMEKLTTVVAGNGGPPLVTPTVDEHGLVDVPASLFLYSFEGVALQVLKPIVGDPVVELARRGVDAARTGDGVFHLWLHPNNLVGQAQVRRLEQILEYVDEHRDEAPVETMADVAERADTRRRESADPGSQSVTSGL